MKADSYYPGSMGEIIQGSFRGKDILVSCPVDIYTNVTVFESFEQKNKHKSPKCYAFLKNLLTEWKFEKVIDNFEIIISSSIPKGKGFASSTADLCAVYYTLLKLFNRKFSEDELIRNCIKIEPTDSIIFRNMTAFEYKNGSYKENLGEYVDFNMLVFEGNKVIDTVEFNQNNNVKLKTIDDLVTPLKEAIQQKNLKEIGNIATESILRNQDRLKYDVLHEVLKIKNTTDGLGIIGAHSGDALAILYEEEKFVDNILKKLSGTKGYKIYKLKSAK